MAKEIFLLQGTDAESYREFRARVFEAVETVSNQFKPDAIKFTITEEAPPAWSVIPFSKRKLAAVSVHSLPMDGRAVFMTMKGFRGAYQVDEVLPVSYQKDWPDGVVTPGVCLLTVFSKKKTIDYATFIDRWHNGHTPLSLRIHPLWNYVRNEVKNLLSGNSVPFNGIVEEQMRTPADLLNPFRFFGNPIIIIPRMIQVYADTKSFIDYATMETYLAAEYHVKSR